jgi:hypothetical protein
MKSRAHGIEFFRNGTGMVKFIGKGKLTTHVKP